MTVRFARPPKPGYSFITCLKNLRNGKQKFAPTTGVCDLVQDAPEDAWKIIDAIRRLDGTDLILSNLAAGPLEDLLVAHGDKFLDRLEALAQDDQRFRKLLGGTWQKSMPDKLWARIKAIAAPPW
jgi:hypothetical protein